MGTIAASSISGLILHYTNSNWELVFYFFGILAIVWFFFFVSASIRVRKTDEIEINLVCLLQVILCYSTPAAHPFISEKEKEYLIKHIGQLERSETQGGTPWRILLTSTPVLALILCAIAHDWCYFVITTDLPKYMNDVLFISIKDNGIYNAVPWVVRMIISFASSFASDFVVKRQYISVTNARKVAVFLGMY